MRLDKFKNPIFNEDDMFNAIYAGHISSLTALTIDPSNGTTQLSNISEVNFKIYNELIDSLTIPEYDQVLQENWFMPASYYHFDIAEFCMAKCITEQQKNRISAELIEFKNYNMMTLLQWLKYFVDTCTTNDIFWGVGRGSSVASYVLYMIGVHRIDSLKYDLDYKEFLR